MKNTKIVSIEEVPIRGFYSHKWTPFIAEAVTLPSGKALSISIPKDEVQKARQALGQHKIRNKEFKGRFDYRSVISYDGKSATVWIWKL